MRRRDAIRLIRNAGKRRSAVISFHANEEIENKNLQVTYAEIWAALAGGRSFERQPNDRWLVRANDLSSVVLIAGRKVIVWTVF